MKKPFILCATIALLTTPVFSSDGLQWEEETLTAVAPTKKSAVVAQKVVRQNPVIADSEIITGTPGSLAADIQLSGKSLPVWTGTAREYDGGPFQKTVDIYDGAPIWDNGVRYPHATPDYYDGFEYDIPLGAIDKKNADKFFDIDTRSCPWEDSDMCRQWLEEYHAVQYLPRPRLAAPKLNSRDEITEYQIEKLLQPRKPGNHWGKDGGGLLQPSAGVVYSDINIQLQQEFPGCPFDTLTECEIWKKKPHVRESVGPRSPKLRAENMDSLIILARENPDLDSQSELAKPLVNRYRALMNASRQCCTDGIAHELKSAGASDGLVYKFMVDDANFYQFGDRCLMTTDAELDRKYPNTATAAVVADVRNGCLCRQKKWYKHLLNPYAQVYNKVPEFQSKRFDYTYTDGLKRTTTTDINTDVINVLKQLEMCP
jgi:hypothetical protein